MAAGSRLDLEEPADESESRPTWRPTASLEMLSRRADVLRYLREFFRERGVLEVETPMLSHAAVQDAHLRSITVTARSPEAGRYLHTSPELAMKRLLAAGVGPIYQLCKVFRDGECGRLHNPEFTMLEWYRPGFDLHQIMDEVEALLDGLLGTGPCAHMAYGQAFEEHVGLNPHSASLAQLRRRARDVGVQFARGTRLDRNGLLDLLFSHSVAPHLGDGEPTFVLDWPVGQAALARIRSGPPPTAERFELFVNGIELANGYNELVDPLEHSLRLELEKWRRRQQRLEAVPVDTRFLAAVYSGLPDCVGVALGVDRLVMLATGAARVEDVIAFPAALA